MICWCLLNKGTELPHCLKEISSSLSNLTRPYKFWTCISFIDWPIYQYIPVNIILPYSQSGSFFPALHRSQVPMTLSQFPWQASLHSEKICIMNWDFLPSLISLSPLSLPPSPPSHFPSLSLSFPLYPNPPSLPHHSLPLIPSLSFHLHPSLSLPLPATSLPCPIPCPPPFLPGIFSRICLQCYRTKCWIEYLLLYLYPMMSTSQIRKTLFFLNPVIFSILRYRPCICCWHVNVSLDDSLIVPKNSTHLVGLATDELLM